MSGLFPAELSKHKRYEIRMSVYNAVGEGPSSPPQEVFVGEAGTRTSWRGGGLLPVLTMVADNGPLNKHRLLKVSLCVNVPPVPTAPPQNVAIQSSAATQLDVTWAPPPMDAQNGDIQGYKVLFHLCIYTSG